MIGQTMKEGDTPGLIKALITQMKEKLEVDEDTFPELIREVEAYAGQTADAAPAAVLHSMVAEMYSRYYRQNSWTIERRTPLEGYVPDDLREWTSNLFTDKIKEHLDASLQPDGLLKSTPVAQFGAILTEGKDSPALRPSLYEFLAGRALDIQPSETLYRELLAYQQTLPDRKAALLTELGFLKYTYSNSSSEEKQTEYEAALDRLLAAYADKDYSVEIVLYKLEKLRYRPYRTGDPDSARAAEYRLAKETVARFPRYERIGMVGNWLASMEEPRLQVESNNTVYPGTDLKLKLNYTNLSSITVKVYKSLKTTVEASPYHYDPEARSRNTKGELVREATFPLTMKNTYTANDTAFTLRMDGNGLYEYVITSSGKDKVKVENTFAVTRLAGVSRTSGGYNADILVMDYRSGKPVADATVNYYLRQKGKMEWAGSAQTNPDGIAQLANKKGVEAYQVAQKDDGHALITNLYLSSSDYLNRSSQEEVRLLTDRIIYRPGQTVFFKGIAYLNDKDNSRTLPGKKVEVALRDANNKEVTKKTFTSNPFGSFQGEFTLPRQTLTGIFTLSTENYSTDIQVEEYKRPTFKVEMDSVKGDIAFGDDVTLRGKAQTFSGVSLKEGEVSYRVVRRPYWFRSIHGGYQEEQVAEGKTTVGSDGAFSFPFRPEKKEGIRLLDYQTYTVYLSLTDSKGETQETQSSFSVGDRSIVLYTNIGSELEKEKARVDISARTLNGETVQTEGTYTICALTEGKDQSLTEGSVLAKGSFRTGEALAGGVFARLPSNRLRLTLTASDSKGRPVTEKTDFILYSKKDKRPPVFMHTWLLTESTSCLPGETAEVVFGTSDQEAYLLYELISNGKIVSRERLVLNNENRTFRIPFRESYDDGVIAAFTFLKEGVLYTRQATINRKRPDRTLTIRPETFRDRLLPGSRETWRFRITGPDSLPASAEMLAGMYDASLDQIRSFDWRFAPVSYPYVHYNPFAGSAGMRSSTGYASQPAAYKDVPSFAYDRIDWQGALDLSAYPRSRSYAGGVLMKQQAAPMAVEMAVSQDANAAVATSADAAEAAPAPFREQGYAAAEEPPAPAPIRTNFNETAFFYPTLTTDKDGSVVVSFTIPESNTTWKLQALAHTADLKYGLLTREVITQKPLMVLPNLPRFMRRGDQLALSTQVINLSGNDVAGLARLELFDPANDEPVACLTKAQKPFTLAAGQTATVSWTVQAPEGMELVGCRIVAESDAYSDGEQHLIPVLPDEILVTESTPFYLLNEKEKEVSLSGAPSGTRRPYRLTFELTANPVWYAVQALPTVAQPDNENILSWFASYYSNTVAQSIARSNPKIKSVISQWTAQGGTASTLLSNLEQNEELKSILLEETPWVLEARTETEQKQRLELLFDENRTSQLREAAMRVVLEQQTVDGGWGWFKSFYPSRSITLRILDGMAQLIHLGAVQYNQEEKEMQIKALQYLDKSIRKDYESIKANKKKIAEYVPTDEQLAYLYVRSYYRDIPEWGDAREGIRFLTNQAEKYWEKASLYGKGQTALLMYRNGKKDTAGKILAWLRKTATTSDEMGMYWANNKRGGFFVSPIDIHCLLMSAFQEMGAGTTETDRMKQWLLNQKRTQNWESVPATVHAIYSILATGSDWLSDGNDVSIQFGGKTFRSSTGETATGYIKESLPANEIDPSVRTMTVRKDGDAPSWGAVYNQYFESVEKISKQKGALNVEKKLFVETNSGSSRQLTPVTADRPLKVGDKLIVRLTIRTDRDMEYVSLKDLRAGCLEPDKQVSGMAYADRIPYYRSPKDVSENFFFEHLPAGTHVLEYAAYVSRSGQFSSGIATIQCMYAPEFVSHTEGGRIMIND